MYYKTRLIQNINMALFVPMYTTTKASGGDMYGKVVSTKTRKHEY